MPLLRNTSEAIAWAFGQNRWAPHSCLNFVKNAYYGDNPTQNSLDGKPYLANAIDGWNNSTMKHPKDTNVPDGALMYFAGAHPGDPGDVQIKVSGNRSRRTDVGAWGVVGTTDMMWMQNVVGREYLGWTGDILGLPYFDSHTDPTPDKPEDQPVVRNYADMYVLVPLKDNGGWIVSLITGKKKGIPDQYTWDLLNRLKNNNGSDVMLKAEMDICRNFIKAVNQW